VINPLGLQPPARDPAQVVVHNRHQPAVSGPITLAPCHEQPRYVLVATHRTVLVARFYQPRQVDEPLSGPLPLLANRAAPRAFSRTGRMDAGNPRTRRMNMDSTIQRAGRGLALLAVLASTLALTAAEANAQAASASQSKQLIGGWILQVTVVDCATRVPTGHTFWSLVTFAQGGTLTNVTTGSNPVLRSTGLGTWEKAGDHAFTSVTMAFLFSAAGAWTGTQRIANTLEIGRNPDELTGTTDVNFFDTSGTLTSTACADVTGDRLE
jgi:hypothetical protein